MTEETGQLPTRTAIELPDGRLTKYELVGVDMGHAFPEPGTHIERRSTEANGCHRTTWLYHQRPCPCTDLAGSDEAHRT
jgi:hypothetical protein